MRHVSVQPCSDGRRQRQEEAEAEAKAKTDKKSPEGEEGNKEEEEEGAKKWGFEAKGLPATRQALQQYVDAPIPAELVGRKWYVEPSSWPNPALSKLTSAPPPVALPGCPPLTEWTTRTGPNWATPTAPVLRQPRITPFFVFVSKRLTDCVSRPWSVGCTAAAADLPPLIRGLASRSSDVQKRCLGTLYGNAIHQGPNGSLVSRSHDTRSTRARSPKSRHT